MRELNEKIMIRVTNSKNWPKACLGVHLQSWYTVYLISISIQGASVGAPYVTLSSQLTQEFARKDLHKMQMVPSYLLDLKRAIRVLC